jgi:purine-nucleoside phosphorylase
MKADELSRATNPFDVEDIHTVPCYIDTAGINTPAYYSWQWTWSLADSVQNTTAIPYAEIPHMPKSSTDGHVGKLVVGELSGKSVMVLAGRVHTHDNHPPETVAYAPRLMAMLGVRNFIITNAAGGLNPAYRPGDLMVISNHLSLFLPRDPSLGIEHKALGPKFYPQTDPYDLTLAESVHQLAPRLSLQTKVHKGVYAFVPGPRYESRFDVQFLRKFDVDAVGMSTVPEVLALAQMSFAEGMSPIRVLGISCRLVG